MIIEKVKPFATWLRDYGFKFVGHYSDKRAHGRKIKFYNLYSDSIKVSEYEAVSSVLVIEATKYYKYKYPEDVVEARMVKEQNQYQETIYSLEIRIY